MSLFFSLLSEILLFLSLSLGTFISFYQNFFIVFLLSPFEFIKTNLLSTSFFILQLNARHIKTYIFYQTFLLLFSIPILMAFSAFFVFWLFLLFLSLYFCLSAFKCNLSGARRQQGFRNVFFSHFFLHFFEFLKFPAKQFTRQQKKRKIYLIVFSTSILEKSLVYIFWGHW